MGRLSDAVMENFLDVYFGGATPAFSGTYYLGLSVSSIAPTSDGQNVVEPSGMGYERVAIAPGDWSAAVDRVKSNNKDLQFPAATGSWGIPYFYVLYNTPTGTAGSGFIGYGEIENPTLVEDEGQPSFPIGSVAIDAPAG